MKKGIFALLLVCTLCLALTACDSADYEEAMELYGNGEYQEAAERFDQLGDYEDSAEMVIRCKQKYVEELLEEGHYAKAIPVMEALDTLGELKEEVNLLAWCRVAAYLEENDVFITRSTDEEWKQGVKLEFSDDGKDIEILVVETARNAGDVMAIEDLRRFVLLLSRDNARAIYGAQAESHYDVFDNSYFQDAVYEESNFGAFDITQYHYGDILECEEQDFSGTNMMGQEMTESLGMFQSHDPVARQMTAIALAVENMELGITIRDLGFVCFEIPEE